MLTHLPVDPRPTSNLVLDIHTYPDGTPGTAAYATLNPTWANYVDAIMAKGIHVHFGEFGDVCTPGTTPAQANFTPALMKFLSTRKGISWTAWGMNPWQFGPPPNEYELAIYPTPTSTTLQPTDGYGTFVQQQLKSGA